MELSLPRAALTNFMPCGFTLAFTCIVRTRFVTSFPGRCCRRSVRVVTFFWSVELFGLVY